ncbi:hypothetical protein DAH55_03900 [Sphingomonas koreensis]|uniref:hypothetical protein n=1 Tax=Sphingomonas koreensis TaxID=93064 RepID=UPI0008328B33|nr:hypothetical protein [Sphingomonas koreensis]PJI89054.1 hypothetical protein BDW16_2360 [Sphingomonas koreensis]RSU63364.1 hypothetical protein DAH56_00355 [Sphingomonas koreensis]RSU71029.1 hypothetical protein DAH55_03900 [Sphingomonas koreensis]
MPKKPKWNEVSCDACREPIAVDAKRCPHCQTDFTPEQVAARKKQHGKELKVGCGALLALVALLAIVGQCTNSGGVAVKNETAAAPAAARSSTQSGKADAVAFYRNVVSAMAPCDAGGKRSAEAADLIRTGRASVFDGYTASREQAEGCRESASSFIGMDPPASFTGEAEVAADKAIKVCGDAAIMKQMAGETMMEIYDGEARPSKVAELKDRIEAAQGGVLACVANAMDAATKAGADLKELAK